jgi:hypothetical protein
LSLVFLDQPIALLIVILELSKLHSPQSGMNLVDPVIKAIQTNIVSIGMSSMSVPCKSCHSMRSKQSDPLGHTVIVGCNHSTFTNRHILIAEEGKTSNISEISSRSSVWKF